MTLIQQGQSVQASFEPAWVHKGPLDPEDWSQVITDAQSLLTRVGTLHLLTEGFISLDSHVQLFGLLQHINTDIAIMSQLAPMCPKRGWQLCLREKGGQAANTLTLGSL